MTGGDDQKQIRKLDPKIDKDSPEDFFLATMRAAAKKDGSRRVDLQVAQDFVGHTWIQQNVFWIVLDAANDLNPITANANCTPAIGIFRFLNANEIEPTKKGRDEKAKPAKSFFRAGRQARVDECDRNSARVREGNEIRPDLGFDQNNPCRVNDGERVPHDRPEIERRIHHFDPGRCIHSGEGKSGRGRGR